MSEDLLVEPVAALPQDARGHDGEPLHAPRFGEARVAGVEAGPRDSGREKGRIVGLDGLRGVAALGVVVYHFTTCYQVNYSFDGPLPFSFQYGMYGVPLFFMISGFVIFMTIERAKSPREFVKSRFIRLYPAYWLSILICVATIVLTRGPEVPMTWGRVLRRSLANVSMVQGWFHIGSINGAYWTLAVEMTFYAIVLILLVLRRLGWTVPVLAAVVALGAIDGVFNARWPGPISPWLRSSLALDYIHYILIGVLIYKMRKSPRPAYAVLAILCLFAPYTQDPSHHEPAKEAIVGAVLAVVVALTTNGWIRPMGWKPFVFLGAISYSLYLNHSLLGNHIIFHAQRWGWSPAASILLAISASVLLATAITYLFEMPVMAALRRRLSAAHQARRPIDTNLVSR